MCRPVVPLKDRYNTGHMGILIQHWALPCSIYVLKRDCILYELMGPIKLSRGYIAVDWVMSNGVRLGAHCRVIFGDGDMWAS